jgi:hypothetical protein
MFPGAKERIPSVILPNICVLFFLGNNVFKN